MITEIILSKEKKVIGPLVFAARTEPGKVENGGGWLAYQACKIVSKTEVADCVSDKQLWYDNCCIESKLLSFWFVYVTSIFICFFFVPLS